MSYIVQNFMELFLLLVPYYINQNNGLKCIIIYIIFPVEKIDMWNLALSTPIDKWIGMGELVARLSC